MKIMTDEQYRRAVHEEVEKYRLDEYREREWRDRFNGLEREVYELRILVEKLRDAVYPMSPNEYPRKEE